MRVRRKMTFRVMRIREDGTLSPVIPTSATTFDNPYDAENLAYELSKATKENYTVSQIFR